MILSTIRMKVFPEKRKELFQTISSLVSSIRKEKGCKRCDCVISAEDEDEFCLLGEWENREDLDKHLQSNVFRVLLGAMSLLKESHEMTLYEDLLEAESSGAAAAEKVLH